MDLFDSDSLYHIFAQVIRLHYHRVHALLDKIGLYPGQPPMLITLYHKDGQSQKELAEKLNVKPATITVMLSRMEKSGFIERKQDAMDQRISRVYLTDAGKEICKEVIEILKGIDHECFNNFTSEDQALLKRLLMQIRENLMKASDKETEE